MSRQNVTGRISVIDNRMERRFKDQILIPNIDYGINKKAQSTCCPVASPIHNAKELEEQLGAAILIMQRLLPVFPPRTEEPSWKEQLSWPSKLPNSVPR